MFWVQAGLRVAAPQETSGYASGSIHRTNSDIRKVVFQSGGPSDKARKVGIFRMYGPPPSCKRKSELGSWSAPMYSAFSGVNDSWP